MNNKIESGKYERKHTKKEGIYRVKLEQDSINHLLKIFVIGQGKGYCKRIPIETLQRFL